ncbi:MAG: YetF domain-containing protein [Solirubrobacteraceae bacterium]
MWFRTRSSARTRAFPEGRIGAVTLVTLNAGITRLIARSPRVARGLEGTATTVIEDGAPVEHAVRRLALRPQDLEHAIRIQNGDSIDEMAHGVLEPSGQLVLSLKASEQAATKEDIANILARMDALKAKLETSRAP